MQSNFVAQYARITSTHDLIGLNFIDRLAKVAVVAVVAVAVVAVATSETVCLSC